MLLNAFRRLFNNSPNRKARRACPPQLLQLEGRIVPATITVLNTNDSGADSLRQAIINANTTPGNDIINFSSSPVTIITLASALPNIINSSTAITGGTAGTVTINGLGASSITIDANKGNFSIFSINTGGNLSISGVTVTGANTSGNGGAFNNSGILTLTNSTISGNTASGNFANNNGRGGAIYNNSGGTLNINNSILSGNSAYVGGGIYNRGTATITNSTLSGNTATNGSGGGGIFNFGGGGGSGSGGTVTVSNSTLSGNSASGNGGGIFNNGSSTLNIANTISGGDFAGFGTVNLINGATAANNIVTLGSFQLWATTVSVLNLGSLTNNGGPTETIALTSLTPASVTAGGNAFISNSPIYANGLDQRGYTRSSNTPSIGAYEFNGTAPVPTVTSISPNSASTAGGTVITITGTNLTGATGVTIGGVAATNVIVVSSTTITATTPAGTAGANKSVLVTSAGGTNAANTLFTYAAAPTDITLSNNSVAENSAIGTVVGTLSTTDVTPGDSFTYSLVSGTGSTDNASFTINGNSLELNVVPNFETKTSYTVRVRTTDAGGLFFEKAFTITITNVNEAPVITSGSTGTVAENAVISTVIYSATSTDVDARATVTYSIKPSVGDAGLVSIDATTGAVTLLASANFEVKSSYTFTVVATDNGTLTAEKVVTVTELLQNSNLDCKYRLFSI